MKLKLVADRCQKLKVNDYVRSRSRLDDLKWLQRVYVELLPVVLRRSVECLKTVGWDDCTSATLDDVSDLPQ
jgi:hypothetical protein